MRPGGPISTDVPALDNGTAMDHAAVAVAYAQALMAHFALFPLEKAADQVGRHILDFALGYPVGRRFPLCGRAPACQRQADLRHKPFGEALAIEASAPVPFTGNAGHLFPRQHRAGVPDGVRVFLLSAVRDSVPPPFRSASFSLRRPDVGPAKT